MGARVRKTSLHGLICRGSRRPHDVSSGGTLRASQWHSARISSTSWVCRLRNPGGRPMRNGVSQLRAALFDGPCPPARETLGLARQVFQRAHDCEETAAQRPGIDGVVLRRRHRLRERALRARAVTGETRESWDRNRRHECGVRPCGLCARRPLPPSKSLRGSNNLKDAPRLCLPWPLREMTRPAGNGRLGRRLHHDVARRDDDQSPHR